MIYSIGEALIDIFETESGTLRFAGGASAAFCSAVSSLGGNAALIAKLGGDSDGKLILQHLKDANVNTDYVFIDPNHNTGKIIIAPSGSAMCLLRKNAADMFLHPDEIPDELFKKDDILHFCSMGLLESPQKYAHIKAINAASEAGAIIAFDLNFRPRQWQSAEKCLQAIDAVIPMIDYIKASKEELQLLFPALTDETAVLSMLERSIKLKCVIITDGSNSATAYLKKNRKLSVLSYQADTVDATGAGDCFFGAFLLNMERIEAFSASGEVYSACVKKSLDYASAAASLSSERQGAFCKVRAEDVEKRLQSVKPI